MAHPHDELRAARAAVLLRCQTARQERARIETARAAWERSAAVAREKETRTALADGARETEREIAAIEEAMLVGPLDQGMLRTMATRETAAFDRVRMLERDIATATLAVAAADDRLDTANAALFAERRATRKRQRLVDETAKVWRAALDARQEAEREDQVSDTWRPT